MKYKIYTIDPTGKDDHLSIHVTATSATRASEMVNEITKLLATEPKEGKCNCWRQLCNNTSDEKHGDYCASTKEESKPVKLPEIEKVKLMLTDLGNPAVLIIYGDKINEIIARLNILTKGR